MVAKQIIKERSNWWSQKKIKTPGGARLREGEDKAWNGWEIRKGRVTQNSCSQNHPHRCWQKEKKKPLVKPLYVLSVHYSVHWELFLQQSSLSLLHRIQKVGGLSLEESGLRAAEDPWRKKRGRRRVAESNEFLDDIFKLHFSIVLGQSCWLRKERIMTNYRARSTFPLIVQWSLVSYLSWNQNDFFWKHYFPCRVTYTMGDFLSFTSL